MFVLLMLFLFKYIDDLIGKGFDQYVILQLLWYASATNVAMALPLAMLLSSIMTFGNLGESSELTAIKAAGISIKKAMMPLLIFVSLFSVGAFFFSDYMLPIANLKMGSLLYDVREKKADFFIKDGVFNNSIPGYSIRAEKKSKSGTTLYNLIIYQHSNSGMNVLLADEGVMYNSEDNNYMVLRLKNGVRYEESSGKKVYNPRQQFTRYYFEQTEQKFDMSAFQMKRTDEGLFKKHYAMLNLKQLSYYTDSIVHFNDSLRSTILPEIIHYYPILNRLNPQHSTTSTAAPYQNNLLTLIPEDAQETVLNQAMNEVRYIQDIVSMRANTDAEYSSTIRRYIMEYQRKFTLPVACLLLFSIGAPLGAIIRKGGLGLPVVMAIIFFLIFHIISTVAEKSAREGNIDPVLGMWTAIIALAPLGIFLTYKAANDSALFVVESYRLWLKSFLNKVKSLFSKS
jgi:lipopolysaccharide export system permease protein